MVRQDVETLESDLKGSPFIQIISNVLESTKQKEAPVPKPQYREYQDPGHLPPPADYQDQYNQPPQAPQKHSPKVVGQPDPRSLQNKPPYGYYPNPNYPSREQIQQPPPQTKQPTRKVQPQPDQYYPVDDYNQDEFADYDNPNLPPTGKGLQDPSMYDPVPPNYSKNPNQLIPQGFTGNPNHPQFQPPNYSQYQQYEPQGEYSPVYTPQYPPQPHSSSQRKESTQQQSKHSETRGTHGNKPYVKDQDRGYPQNVSEEDQYKYSNKPHYPEQIQHYSKKKDPQGKSSVYKPSSQDYEQYEGQRDTGYKEYYPHHHDHPSDKQYYQKGDKPYGKQGSERQPAGYDKRKGSGNIHGPTPLSGSRGEGSFKGPQSVENSQNSQNPAQGSGRKGTTTGQHHQQHTSHQYQDKYQAQPPQPKHPSAKKQQQPTATVKQSSKQKGGNFEDNIMEQPVQHQTKQLDAASSHSSISSHQQPDNQQGHTNPSHADHLPASDTLASTPDVKFIDPNVENINRKPGFNRMKKRVFLRDEKLKTFKERAQSVSPGRNKDEQGLENLPDTTKLNKSEEDLKNKEELEEGSEDEFKPTKKKGSFHFHESSGESEENDDRHEDERIYEEEEGVSHTPSSDEKKKSSQEDNGDKPLAPVLNKPQDTEGKLKPSLQASDPPQPPLLSQILNLGEGGNEKALDTIEENNE